ncbi:hypothetical protein KCP70_03755 [Salmonella enterica subsp. enterica]|nr:hypothetical protein KCP70_03755 [Salmonella enterica subsp. enterica]
MPTKLFWHVVRASFGGAGAPCPLTTRRQRTVGPVAPAATGQFRHAHVISSKPGEPPHQYQAHCRIR